MPRPAIELLALPLGDGVLAHLPRLAAALDGGAPVLPYAAATPPPQLPADIASPRPAPDLAVVVGTSGSTGTPKRALLGAAALRASIAGTAARLRPAGEAERPGQWLLAVPPHHIAGLQVLFRSLVAGTTPVPMDLVGGFTPAAFVAAAGHLDPGLPHLTALVPTQVLRLLDDPRASEVLRRFDAVLVGGSAIPPHLLRRGRAEGVRLVTTYGMSETAGGCVYDGRPLDGVRVEIDADQRILLGGPVLAHGYLGRPDLTAQSFGVDTERGSWFRTDDVGRLDDDGCLHVDGRVDDLITSGGLKIAPRLVEEAVHTHVPGVREVAVLGVPDPEWGEIVGVVLVLAPTARRASLSVPDLRAALRGAVPAHALPRRVAVVRALPLTGPGKPDRKALAALLHHPQARGRMRR